MSSVRFLVATALVVAVGLPALAGTASAAPAANETGAADGISVPDVVKTEAGETVRIPISFGEADAVRVRIGGPDVNYQINVTVHDENDDGRAVVLFDTYDAMTSETTLFVEDPDAGSNLSETEPGADPPLDVASYPVEAAPAANPSAAPVTGTLKLFDVPVGERSDRTAPGGSVEIVQFERDLVSVERNEVSRIPMSVSEGGAATLSVSAEGYENVSYRATVTVRDGNGDGRVVAVFDPAAVGIDVPTFESDAAADTVRVEDERMNETVRRDGLPSGVYELTLHRGEGATDASPAYALLQLTERNETAASGTATPNGSDASTGALGSVPVLGIGALLAIAGVGLLTGLFRI
ncbi:surface glycoprotein [Halorientalis brevis]|uniref:Surface glycoprotein n=1 Tax=Halorientalis brevis TaxID=1126241 RepID=A0ABD6CDC7_9EURY|nr:hypothetical protein [Halorientalis brevis]